MDVLIDNIPRAVSEDGAIGISLAEVRSGFKLEHSSKQSLFLSAEVVGDRSTISKISNGFNVYKRIFNEDGIQINFNNELPIKIKQGDILTVIIEIQSNKKYIGNLLITDLLPSGFEILANDPTNFSQKLYIPKYGKFLKDVLDEPDYKQAMDDRFVANFNEKSRWRRGNNTTVSYQIRAVYPGRMVVPDTHVELMYQPEINGRSIISRIRVE